MYIFIYVYVRMCVCVYVCMCVCAYVCMCACAWKTEGGKGSIFVSADPCRKKAKTSLEKARSGYFWLKVGPGPSKRAAGKAKAEAEARASRGGGGERRSKKAKADAKLTEPSGPLSFNRPARN